MHAFAAAGAAFLICVLWFDLMFDAQVRGHDGEAGAGSGVGVDLRLLPGHFARSMADEPAGYVSDAP